MKYLLTKDMYLRLHDFDQAVELTRCCPNDLILCVYGAYRVKDGKLTVENIDGLAKVLEADGEANTPSWSEDCGHIGE